MEADRKFRIRSGWSIPPGATDIDVQGFVFMDPGHTATAWHHHSGWEIHSCTAWRRSPKPASAVAAVHHCDSAY